MRRGTTVSETPLLRAKNKKDAISESSFDSLNPKPGKVYKVKEKLTDAQQRIVNQEEKLRQILAVEKMIQNESNIKKYSTLATRLQASGRPNVQKLTFSKLFQAPNF